MKISYIFAVLFCVEFSFSHIYAQGIFLEKGEVGFFADGSYSSLENGHATSFGGGFALGGYFELGFTSTNSNLTLDRYGLSDEVEVSSKTISLGVVLLKKKAQLQAEIGFSTSDEGSDVLLLGFSVGSEFKLHEKVSWYPIFSFAAGIPTEEDAGNPITALGLSAPILIGEHFYLGPEFALSEGDFSWGATAGIIISFNTATDGG